MQLFIRPQKIIMTPNEQMHAYIAGFPSHLIDGINTANQRVRALKTGIAYSNVVIVGQGGSGIGGSLMVDLLQNQSPIPIVVCKSYNLPSFVNSKTLVIVYSYSGNTEEAITACKEAFDKRAKILCVSTGGKLQELSVGFNTDFISLPPGFPPRASFAYAISTLAFIFEKKGISNEGFLDQVLGGAQLIESLSKEIHTEAKEIAEAISETLPVIYCNTNMEAVAIRLRQQINENAKKLCWHHVFPEMNHNELVGWNEDYEDVTVLMLKTAFDHPQSLKRMEICKPIFENLANAVIEIEAKGANEVEAAIYLIHLGDWISWYLGDGLGVDTVEINVINYLKETLAAG